MTVTLDTTRDRLTTYLDGALVGSAETTITAGALLSGSATRSGYIGKSFYADPLFGGAVDDFRVYDDALSAEQVADLVGGTVPTPTALAQDTFDVRTDVGTAPPLPAGGARRSSATATTARCRSSGTPWTRRSTPSRARSPSTAPPPVATSPPTSPSPGPTSSRIDLSKDTGAFHGGASGTLYGLYGDGVPSRNLIEGMNLRTVSTKAQDGPQHPGADALEVVKPLADSTDGDVYIYMTDIHRGFPYEWPGDTPEEKLDGFKAKIAKQVDQVSTLDPEYQDNIVFVPFNEPEGNMFGTGEWSYNGISWLDDPNDYFAAWDDVYALIKGKMPDARIAGPNTSVLYSTRCRASSSTSSRPDTVPDVMTWHELSDPARVRTSVGSTAGGRRRSSTAATYEGTKLPINVNEYAFNYHTSVPGQMIQWISAIEESKVDADIAYWNIDGNLSDSAVQANRGNGQWWLLNAYAQMTGHTVARHAAAARTSATRCRASPRSTRRRRRPARSSAAAPARVARPVRQRRPEAVRQQRARTRPGDPVDRADRRLGRSRRSSRSSTEGGRRLGGVRLRDRRAARAEGVLGVPDRPHAGRQRAVDAVAHDTVGVDLRGRGRRPHRVGLRRGTARRARPSNVAKFYTSGGYDVGGLRTGSDVVLDFTVSVPKTGTYDLSVFANSLNTYDLVAEQGPTNVFLRVDGAAEQEIYLPLGYKWVVWDHADTKVQLTAGEHVITLAARSLDGTRTTKGDAIVDKIDLSLPNPAAAQTDLRGRVREPRRRDRRLHAPARVRPGCRRAQARAVRHRSGSYSPDDGESTVLVDTVGPARPSSRVNGMDIATVTKPTPVKVFLSGGVNKVTVTNQRQAEAAPGGGPPLLLDRLRVTNTDGRPGADEVRGRGRALAGTAEVTAYSRASGGKAVTGVGGDPGNANTLTFDVTVKKAGTYAMTVRYSNPEQSPPSHYNPDPRRPPRRHLGQRR